MSSLTRMLGITIVTGNAWRDEEMQHTLRMLELIGRVWRLLLPGPCAGHGRALLYMDIDLSHGPSYGDTLTWTAPFKPDTDVQLVHAQVDLDLRKFTNMFVALMKSPPGK